MFIIYQLELLFFIVTAIVYVLVLICVYLEWKSKNTLVNISFFQLFFVTGIIDLVAMFGNNVLNVMPKGCLFPNVYEFGWSVFLHAYFVICWGCGTNQSFCVIFIALNRLTTILNPSASSKFWNSRWIYLIFCLQIFPGIITGGFTFISGVYWKIEPDDCALIPSFRKFVTVILNVFVMFSFSKILPNIYFQIAGVYQFVTSAILIIIYSIILISLKKSHSFQKNVCFLFIAFNEILVTTAFLLCYHNQEDYCKSSLTTLSSHNKKFYQRQFIREIRLLIMSSIICGCQVFLSLYLIVRIFTKIDKDFVGVSFIMDICAGINPFLMLVFCGAIRNRLLKLFGLDGKFAVKNVKVQSSIGTTSLG